MEAAAFFPRHSWVDSAGRLRDHGAAAWARVESRFHFPFLCSALSSSLKLQGQTGSSGANGKIIPAILGQGKRNMIFIEHLLCARHSAKSSSTSLGRKGAGAQRTEEDCLTTRSLST